MAEYLTTKEVAAYLHVKEKKVYELVSKGEMPSARVCGKWLFPKHLVDQWVSDHTSIPNSARMESLLDDLLVVQGSNDGLLESICQQYRKSAGVPVVEANVGSVAGLGAVSADRAHLAGCHVESGEVARHAQGGRYLVSLFKREQGIMYNAARNPTVSGIKALANPEWRLADRQPESGTWRLTRRLTAEAGIPDSCLHTVGQFRTHIDVALAVLTGCAELGIGTAAAARQCGLSFIPLHEEVYKLVLPLRLASHPRIAAFLQFTLDNLNEFGANGVNGYYFDVLGRMETIGAPKPACL